MLSGLFRCQQGSLGLFGAGAFDGSDLSALQFLSTVGTFADSDSEAKMPHDLISRQWRDTDFSPPAVVIGYIPPLYICYHSFCRLTCLACQKACLVLCYYYTTSKNGYYTNRHSCFLLQYHLVLVTKYRHPVIVDDLREELISYAKDYFNDQGCPILEINTAEDHIHILFEAPPQICLSKYVNSFKTASAKVMRRKFEDFLAPYYRKSYFWERSYFVGSVSETTTGIVAKYIRCQ